jgi:hypothetical protein
MEDRMTDRDTHEIDAAIAAYRRKLTTTADIAKGDLDEIEDHLRALTAELREQGMPAAVAVTEAAKRLGDPAELAREHERVRPAFGARLPRARVWSAAALLAVVIGATVMALPESAGSWSTFHPIVESACGGVLLLALFARLSWARPILLGAMAYFSASTLAFVVAAPQYGFPVISIAMVGIVAFLAPWRRGELSVAGTALALQAWAYAATVSAFGLHPSNPTIVIVATLAVVMAPILATVGIVLRARWSAVFAAITALALSWVAIEIPVFPHLWIVSKAMITSGAVAAAISAVLQVRTARSTLGSLRAIWR